MKSNWVVKHLYGQLISKEKINQDNIHYFVDSAKKGNGYSCYLLALYFVSHKEPSTEGNWEVVKRDIKKAIKWAKKGVALNDISSLCLLADLYAGKHNSDSSEKVYLAKAKKLYKRGVENNNPYCILAYANILLGQTTPFFEASPYTIGINSISKQIARKALSLYLKLNEECTDNSINMYIADKIAFCYAILSDLKESLKWYIIANKSNKPQGSFNDLISEIKDALTAKSSLSQKLKEFKHNHSEFFAEDIFGLFISLLVFNSHWASSKENERFKRLAVTWFKERLNYHRSRLLFIEDGLKFCDA